MGHSITLACFTVFLRTGCDFLLASVSSLGADQGILGFSKAAESHLLAGRSQVPKVTPSFEATLTAGWEIPVPSSRPRPLFFLPFCRKDSRFCSMSHQALTLALSTFLKFPFLPGPHKWSSVHTSCSPTHHISSILCFF